MGETVSRISNSGNRVLSSSGGTLLGGAIAGPAGAQIGGLLDADAAAQEQAEALRRAGEAELAQQERMRAQALGFAAPSEYEIARMQEAYNLNDRDLKRRESIIASADPALLEAGTQALQLLRGDKEAGSLSVIRKQREQQRQKLTDKLKAQFGPGALNSSAGIQALTAFDSASDDLLQQAQERTTNSLLGLAERNASNFGTQQNFANLMGLQQAQGQIQGRQLNAALGAPVTSIGGDATADYLRALQRGKNAAAVGALFQPGGDSGETGGALALFKNFAGGKTGGFSGV